MKQIVEISGANGEFNLSSEAVGYAKKEQTMNECLILVDNSNVFIGGQKLSARKRKLPKDADDPREPIDWDWRIDFGALLRHVANGHDIIKAFLVGSTPPPNDSLWKAAKVQGFEVTTYKRDFSNKEKAVDTTLVAAGLKVIYKHGRPAILKLLSGDRDFLPLIQCAYEEGWETELWGFSADLSYELSQTVSRVQLLDSVYDRIGRIETSHERKA